MIAAKSAAADVQPICLVTAAVAVSCGTAPIVKVWEATQPRLSVNSAT